MGDSEGAVERARALDCEPSHECIKERVTKIEPACQLLADAALQIALSLFSETVCRASRSRKQGLRVFHALLEVLRREPAEHGRHFAHVRHAFATKPAKRARQL